MERSGKKKGGSRTHHPASRDCSLLPKQSELDHQGPESSPQPEEEGLPVMGQGGNEEDTTQPGGRAEEGRGLLQEEAGGSVLCWALLGRQHRSQ